MSNLLPGPAARPFATAAAVAALVAAATAMWVGARARKAERTNLPRGQFLEVDGVRLHYVESGTGPAVVLLHGNAVSLEDFESSGLLSALSHGNRVIAFDRPGFGHSERPRNRLWTPTAQAKLLRAAMAELGIERPVLIGHSMGTVVALALALAHPEDVSGLILLGGYYYPTLRLDALLGTPAALPVLGDVLSYTATALSARALLRTSVKAMFAPAEVPANFFPTISREMMLRPSQLRADVEDGVFLMPAAKANAARYGELRMPVVIMAGAGDKIVDPATHSKRLHEDVADSELVVRPGAGHMVHHGATQQVSDILRRMHEELGDRPEQRAEEAALA